MCIPLRASCFNRQLGGGGVAGEHFIYECVERERVNQALRDEGKTYPWIYIFSWISRFVTDSGLESGLITTIPWPSNMQISINLRILISIDLGDFF
jgi:hypothetical protein